MKAARTQPIVALPVISILSMLPAIDFDDRHAIEARKVDDIRTDWHLAFEFMAVETMSRSRHQSRRSASVMVLRNFLA